MTTAKADGEFAVYLDQYAFNAPWKAVREESGMNNTTRIVYAGNQKYVLRVYDNHRDRRIVEVEHEVLAGLRRAELPFGIPEPVVQKDGSTIAVSPEGKLAALYRYIDGSRPSAGHPGHVEGLGRAAGLLSRALRTWTPDALPVYSPYYEFAQTHAAMTEDGQRKLLAGVAHSAEDESRLERLIERQRRAIELRPDFSALPRQWVHGDIVLDNALADGDSLVALLDFEFCTVDASAMEPAVVLAEFPDADEPKTWGNIASFCRGYGSAVKLSGREIELLPELAKLRMLDVLVHFAGRSAAGLDAPGRWLAYVRRVSVVCDWFDSHVDKLRALMHRHMS